MVPICQLLADYNLSWYKKNLLVESPREKSLGDPHPQILQVLGTNMELEAQPCAMTVAGKAVIVACMHNILTFDL